MSDRYAIVKDNLIVNLIVADKSLVDKFYPDAILCFDGVGVGDGYADGEFFSNSIAVVIEEDGETL
jgi:hypothetical protein